MIKPAVILALLVVMTSALWDEDLELWQPPDSAESILTKAENILEMILEDKPIPENLSKAFSDSVRKDSLTKVHSCDWFGGLFFPSTCKHQDGSNLEACDECSNRMQKVCINKNEDFIAKVEPKVKSLVYEVSWLYNRMEQLKNTVKIKTEVLRNSTKNEVKLLGEVQDLRLELQRVKSEFETLNTMEMQKWMELSKLDERKQADINELKSKLIECEEIRDEELEKNMEAKGEKIFAEISLAECKDSEKSTIAELEEAREKLRNTQWELEQLRSGKEPIDTTELLSVIKKLQNSVNELKAERNHGPTNEYDVHREPERKTLGEKILDRAMLALDRN
ncbi:uncharacterized protein LOC124300666 [Neodiprion virginianus]|uniref:uncharacterized protein LOC124300666 n=1 Tax=Neodiprion virginianus TaxID=2961670 RepID=UPI001EE6E42F|nr:uncharacterized protein LOC124300666 [Neodiprion virginianus]